jgi:hypothetical protein
MTAFSIVSLDFYRPGKNREIQNRSLMSHDYTLYGNMCQIGIGSSDAELEVVGKTFWTLDRKTLVNGKRQKRFVIKFV